MATDLADYTQAVNVLGGTVSITGTATVIISGTPAVTISGTPTVNIGTAPTITITGSVSISSGSVTVTGSVTATITSGSVSISSGTVTVQTAAGVPVVIQPGVPGLKDASVNGNLAPTNGTLTVVAAVAGKTITVYRVEVTILGPAPGPTWLVLSNPAQTIVIGIFTGSFMGPQVSEFHGSALNVGDALQLVNTDPSRHIIAAVHANYTQA